MRTKVRRGLRADKAYLMGKKKKKGEKREEKKKKERRKKKEERERNWPRRGTETKLDCPFSLFACS